MKTNWKPNFFTLFVGQQLSFFTSMIAQYALIWYLTDRSKSPTLLAMYMLIALMPGIGMPPLLVLAGGSIFIGNIPSLLLPDVKKLDHMVIMTDAIDEDLIRTDDEPLT
ncbi:hypothetical protein [Pseudolactococcus reticulitermitis]|uniref:Uncharacterized protein n=1 Tax=Pseudolactococcus reticulitermitis TaxID=2025039 RepID=A0A224XF85_9LACT|nr:hypothetical protein [Lactococcus reticulitermitis]GAX48285.1 hypothetical protein RsY01_1901 [Lactococcus reticulitermitis]